MANILTIPPKFHPRHKCGLLETLRQDFQVFLEHGFWAMLREEYLLTDRCGTATKIIKEQLKNRNYDTTMYWDSFDIRSDIRRDVCNIIQDIMDWPNARYLPNDSLDLIFLFSWDSDDFILVCNKIYDKYNVDILDYIFQHNVCIQDMTLSDFLIILCYNICIE